MKNKYEKRKLFSWYDSFIILFVIVIVTLTVFLVFSNYDSDSSDITAVVRKNGDVVDTISLNSIKDNMTKVYGDEIKLEILFSNSSVKVIKADCPDKSCMHKGEIRTAGQNIICVPARVTISLEGNEKIYDSVVS